MPLVPHEDGTRDKRIANEHLTIVYAEMVPSDTKTAPTSTSTDSSEITDSTDESTSVSLGPTDSMKQILDQLEENKQKEHYFGYEPVWRSMSTTDGSKMKSLDYFQSRNIHQLFTFLISHLLAETPEDPIAFLISLVDRCLQYRDRGGDPPLLFQDKHILSVYDALDPLGYQNLWYQQYATGMTTLGLTSFNLLPEDLDESNETVSKETFIKEAKLALLDQLDKILGGSQPDTASKYSLGKTWADEEESEMNIYLYGTAADLNTSKSSTTTDT